MKINRVPDEEDFEELRQQLEMEFVGQPVTSKYMEVMEQRAVATGKTVAQLMEEDLAFLRNLKYPLDEDGNLPEDLENL